MDRQACQTSLNVGYRTRSRNSSGRWVKSCRNPLLAAVCLSAASMHPQFAIYVQLLYVLVVRSRRRLCHQRHCLNFVPCLQFRIPLHVCLRFRLLDLFSCSLPRLWPLRCLLFLLCSISTFMSFRRTQIGPPDHSCWD